LSASAVMHLLLQHFGRNDDSLKSEVGMDGLAVWIQLALHGQHILYHIR